MAAIAADRPHVHRMVVVHRLFTRESRLLAELVPATAVGDRDRVATLAAHFRDYRTALHHHHEAEDELLWPKLLARVDLDADVVLRMEEQHGRIAATLTRASAAFVEWERTADEVARARLAGILREHRSVVADHVHDEETYVLPLIEEHLTVPEWEAFNACAAAGVPAAKRLMLLGAILEDADPRERAYLLGDLPFPVRLLWRLIGRPAYARRMRRVRTGG